MRFVVITFALIVPHLALRADDSADIARCLRVLETSKDRKERRAASERLGEIGEPAFKPLIDAMKHKDKEVRAGAAEAFMLMKREPLTKAIPLLIEAMKSGDEAILEYLAKALAHAEEDAVLPLSRLALAKDVRVEARSAATYSLGRIREKAVAATPLMIELLADVDPGAREAAAYVLGRIGPGAKAAVPALLKAAEDRTPGVRSQVIGTLGSIGEANEEVLKVVLKGLKDTDPDIRQASVSACRSLGPKAARAVPDLVVLLEDQVVNSAEVWPRQVVAALWEIGPAAKPAVPKLVEYLKDPDLEHASHAAAALLSIGAEQRQAVAAFAKALDKSLQPQKSHVRHRTFRVVEQLGAAGKPLAPLIAGIFADESDDRDIRAAAARALMVIDPEAAKKAGLK
jgi:HEAT repeat protein